MGYFLSKFTLVLVMFIGVTVATTIEVVADLAGKARVTQKAKISEYTGRTQSACQKATNKICNYLNCEDPEYTYATQCPVPKTGWYKTTTTIPPLYQNLRQATLIIWGESATQITLFPQNGTMQTVSFTQNESTPSPVTTKKISGADMTRMINIILLEEIAYEETPTTRRFFPPPDIEYTLLLSTTESDLINPYSTDPSAEKKFTCTQYDCILNFGKIVDEIMHLWGEDLW